MQANYHDMITFLKIARYQSTIDTNNGMKYATFVVYEVENNVFPHGVEVVFAFSRSNPILEIYPLTGKWPEISPLAQLCVKKTCDYKIPIEAEINHTSSILYKGDNMSLNMKYGTYFKTLTITLTLLYALILFILTIYVIIILYEKFNVTNIQV